MTLILSVHNSKKGEQRREILRIIGKYRKKGADVCVDDMSGLIGWEPDIIAEKPDGYSFHVVIEYGEKNNSNRGA